MMLEEENDSTNTLLEKGDMLCECKRTQAPPRRCKEFAALQVVLLVLYTVVLYRLQTFLPAPTALRGQPLTHSPASSAIFWEEHNYINGDQINEVSIYSGRPSEELDQAWHDLLETANMRVELEYVEYFGLEELTIRDPDGDGYLTSLHVYHELHCIKRLHQYMYLDEYYPDLNDAQREHHRVHNEHCLDYLRQAAMCHGDVGLMPFGWTSESSIPVAQTTTHQCINWDSLQRWVNNRTVDMLKPGWLHHPAVGLAYPDVKGDPIGVVEGKVEKVT